MLDAARRVGFGDGAQLDLFASNLAARTEQGRVRAGSVEALVERRHAARDELYLRPIQRTT